MTKFLKKLKKKLDDLILKREEKYLRTNEDKLIYHANSILKIIKEDFGDIKSISIWNFKDHSSLEWYTEDRINSIDLRKGDVENGR